MSLGELPLCGAYIEFCLTLNRWTLVFLALKLKEFFSIREEGSWARKPLFMVLCAPGAGVFIAMVALTFFTEIFAAYSWLVIVERILLWFKPAPAMLRDLSATGSRTKFDLLVASPPRWTKVGTREVKHPESACSF